MLRKDARLRKEYLYRKSLQEKEVAHYERKQKLKESLQSSTPLSGDLKYDTEKIAHDVAYDEGLKGICPILTLLYIYF
jgi:U3 small nucleolar ribonucleoprotein protein IMP4